MDPLSSLSVASSAIQIIDFSSKLWKQIHELYQSESGATVAQETLLSNAERLCSLNSGLSKLLAPENLRRAPTTTEKNVVSLCNECDDAAEDLVAKLQELTLSGRSDRGGPKSASLEERAGFSQDQTDVPTDCSPSSRKRKASQLLSGRKRQHSKLIGRNWGAVRLAIKGVWMKKDVDKLCERVEALKHSLASTILVNVQHGIVDLDQKLNSLGAKTVKWENANSFADTLRSQSLDTPSNESKLMDFLKAYDVYTSQPRFSSFNKATETSLPEALRQGDAKLEPWSATSSHIVQSLIKSLSFSAMLQRQESIHENYEGTFQWIYQPPRDADRPWDDFSTWLTEGRGIYWITGKAGSGKSTLMRMLQQNKRTLDLIRTWCSGSPLITASFFFWNSGSKMQMSQEGLLRSVLLQIIEQRLQQGNRTALTEKLVAFTMLLPSLQDVQFKDLVQLFRLVIEDGGSSIKFFLILDGLDEFDGEKSKLVSLIHTLGMYEHVKVCVSSRPYIVFEDGFRQQPSLTLQHLTHRDITHFVKENLEREPSFRELSWAQPHNASHLVESITKKASGVFLWVVLVVDSLAKGLADGDRLKDLEARLDEIPDELEDLFSKMLHGLQGRYFKDAARIFQIHRATRWPGFGKQLESNLPLLVYSFADEHGADLDTTSQWPPRALTAKERFMTSVSMKRRINSRCNGLLEVDEPMTSDGGSWRAKYRQLDRLISEAESGDLSVLPTLYSYGHDLARSNVQYLHRTVKDYLEAPSIWTSIESAAPTEEEDSWVLSLCLGYIMLWKSGGEEDLERTTTSLTAEQLNARRREDSRLMLENRLELTKSFLVTKFQWYVRLLDALGAAIFDGNIAEAECNRQEVLRSAIWNHDTLSFVFEDFLSLAVHLNLFEYVEAKISLLQPSARATRVSRLLIVAVLKREPWLRQTITLPKYSEDFMDYECYTDATFHMIQLLIRIGADPDFQAYGTSARQILTLRLQEQGGSFPGDKASLPFEKILWSFDFAKDKSGSITRRVKSVFHRQ